MSGPRCKSESRVLFRCSGFWRGTVNLVCFRVWDVSMTGVPFAVVEDARRLFVLERSEVSLCRCRNCDMCKFGGLPRLTSGKVSICKMPGLSTTRKRACRIRSQKKGRLFTVWAGGQGRGKPVAASFRASVWWPKRRMSCVVSGFAGHGGPGLPGPCRPVLPESWHVDLAVKTGAPAPDSLLAVSHCLLVTPLHS